MDNYNTKSYFLDPQFLILPNLSHDNTKSYFSFCFSDAKSQKNILKHQKRLKTAKTIFLPALGCTQHPKAGRNTQQIFSAVFGGMVIS